MISINSKDELSLYNLEGKWKIIMESMQVDLHIFKVEL